MKHLVIFIFFSSLALSCTKDIPQPQGKPVTPVNAVSHLEHFDFLAAFECTSSFCLITRNGILRISKTNGNVTDSTWLDITDFEANATDTIILVNFRDFYRFYPSSGAMDYLFSSTLLCQKMSLAPGKGISYLEGDLWSNTLRISFFDFATQQKSGLIDIAAKFDLFDLGFEDYFYINYHDRPVMYLRFFHHSNSNDNEVYLYDIADKKVIAQYHFDEGYDFHSFTFLSKPNTEIAKIHFTRGEKYQTALMDLSTGMIVRNWHRTTDHNASCMHYNKDKLIFSEMLKYKESTITIYDWNNADPVSKFKIPDQWFYTMYLTRNGFYAADQFEKEFLWLDFQGNIKYRLTGSAPPTAILFGSDRYALSLNNYSQIELFDVEK